MSREVSSVCKDPRNQHGSQHGDLHGCQQIGARMSTGRSARSMGVSKEVGMDICKEVSREMQGGQ